MAILHAELAQRRKRSAAIEAEPVAIRNRW
jgi:hypothetical protein